MTRLPESSAGSGRAPRAETPGRSRLGAVAALPRLTWQAIRWGALRGGWLPAHLRQHRPFDVRRLPPNVPVDVIVLVVDHFEPGDRHGSETAVDTVSSWCEAYGAIAGRHRDSDGRLPQHTWFYRAEYPNTGCIRVLSDATFQGYGEVEFHLHHGHDTHESFAAKLHAGLDWFNQVGAMLTAEAQPRRRFGYIAGNWSLDNGTGDPSKGGCNTELIALREAGCYADFTFPAIGSAAQPRKTNAIYYATDDSGPKSYDWGPDVEVGGTPSGDLMIVQGPLMPDWRAVRFEDGSLEGYVPISPDRLEPWLAAHVHVRGRPEWAFIKLHTHAIQYRDAFLSPEIDALFGEMEARWTQPPFRLHYVTAREAYNIAKAAEAGHCGNPDDYRDFEVARPANRRIRCSTPWRLLSFGPDRIALEVGGAGPATVEFADGPLRAVRGKIRRLEARLGDGAVEDLAIEGEGEFEIETVSQGPVSQRLVRGG